MFPKIPITEPVPRCRPHGVRFDPASRARVVKLRAALRRLGQAASEILIRFGRKEVSFSSPEPGCRFKRGPNRETVCVLTLLCSCVLTLSARAQQTQEPEDPEDEKQIGLWIDQSVSIDLPANKSVEVELHERFDEGASNFYEYFVQGGVAFRPRTWFTVIPSYRYQRFPGNPAIAYENRVLLNLTASMSRGSWRPIFRTLFEGRFPDSRPSSARARFRPGIEYTLPVRMVRRPVLILSNEFFIALGTNSFANGGDFTQNRFQLGLRVPMSDSVSARPYYFLQSVNLPIGWDSNQIIGVSLAFKIRRKTK